MNEKQMQEKLRSIEKDIAVNKSQIASAHSRLVNGARNEGASLESLALAETTAKARREALQDMYAETRAALDALEQARKSKEHKQRLAARLQLEQELTNAAKDAVKQLAALEKTVHAAIDKTHAELVKNVYADKTIDSHEQGRITQNSKDFRYLYGLYVYLEKSRKEREQIEMFEKRAAQAI